MTIDYHHLTKIDLNLLLALDALLAERSVTRAATHLGIGQSAMSSALGRLRKLFGDELMTRTPDGMVLTPRAMSLVEPVRSALRHFQTIVLHEDSFDPSTEERAFAIALPGSVEMLLGPLLLAYLQAHAPALRVTFRVFDDATVLSELDADRVDLALGLITHGQIQHKVRPLYRFGYLCLFNADLLKVPVPLSLDDYLRFPHVMTSLSGTDLGVVDEALAAIGRTRRLAATTPRFTTVPFMVQQSPIIVTMVDALAEIFGKKLGLTTSPVPIPVGDFPISMLWHSSYDKVPAHRWLRDVLVQIGKGFVQKKRWIDNINIGY